MKIHANINICVRRTIRRGIYIVRLLWLSRKRIERQARKRIERSSIKKIHHQMIYLSLTDSLFPSMCTTVHLLITKIWIVFDEMTHFSQLVFLDPKRCKQFSNLHFEFRWTSLWNLLSFMWKKVAVNFISHSDDTSNSFYFWIKCSALEFCFTSFFHHLFVLLLLFFVHFLTGNKEIRILLLKVGKCETRRFNSKQINKECVRLFLNKKNALSQ